MKTKKALPETLTALFISECITLRSAMQDG
jgi:hypothetical protein